MRGPVVVRIKQSNCNLADAFRSVSDRLNRPSIGRMTECRRTDRER